jgi:hypothetical protein
MSGWARPCTLAGVRIVLNFNPGVARYRSLTPGYIPVALPACTPKAWRDISAGWSEATPGGIDA